MDNNAQNKIITAGLVILSFLSLVNFFYSTDHDRAKISLLAVPALVIINFLYFRKFKKSGGKALSVILLLCSIILSLFIISAIGLVILFATGIAAIHF